MPEKLKEIFDSLFHTLEIMISNSVMFLAVENIVDRGFIKYKSSFTNLDYQQEGKIDRKAE